MALTTTKEVLWTREEENDFIDYCCHLLNFKTLKDLELRARAGTGTEALFHLGPSCCGNSEDHHDCHKHQDQKDYHKNYKIKKTKDDEIGEMLDSLVSSYGLRDIIKNTVERSATILNGVLQKAKDESGDFSAALNEDGLYNMSSEILKESLIRSVLLKILQRHSNDSKEGGLLATPAGYRNGSLDFLNNETLASLAEKGFAIQDNFMGEEIRKTILHEVELIEFDGQLIELGQRFGSKSVIRSDRMCWIKQPILDREKHRGLLALMERLSALPFELNKKVGLLCQVATIFQLSVFPSNESSYTKHFDSGFTEKMDTGRKLMIEYYPNDPLWEEGYGAMMKVHGRVSREEQVKEATRRTQEKGKIEDDSINNMVREDVTILPKGDRLVILKSREVPYEVTPSYKKRFAITSWISGPQRPE